MYASGTSIGTNLDFPINICQNKHCKGPPNDHLCNLDSIS
jgi:hypothetical protein